MEVLELNGIVWFVVHHFVSSCDCSNVLQHFNSMQSDSSLSFENCDRCIPWNGTVVLFFISEKPRSRFIFELLLLMILLCWFWVLKRIARTWLLRWFFGGFRRYCSSSVISHEDWVFKTIVFGGQCSALDLAVLSCLWHNWTYPGSWLHLSFHGPHTTAHMTLAQYSEYTPNWSHSGLLTYGQAMLDPPTQQSGRLLSYTYAAVVGCWQVVIWLQLEVLWVCSIEQNWHIESRC